MLPTRPPSEKSLTRTARGTLRARYSTAAGRVPIGLSGRRQRELELARREAQLLKAQEIAAIGSWELDVRTHVLVCSPEMERIFGWGEGFAPELSAILEVTHPDDRITVGNWLSRNDLGQPSPRGCDFRIVRPDRSIRSLHCRSVVAVVERGRVRMLSGTVQDITDRVAAERFTGETEHLYRGIFEHALWGIFQTTEDGRYLRANAALAKIYGYASPAALMSALTNISRQLYVNPTRRAEFVRQMQENGSLSSFESLVYRHDGSLIWISESCREVRANNGDLLYYEGTVEDITGRKHAEADLLAARAEAEQASQTKSLFLANMSHELRTPLNAVLGFSEVLEKELFGPLGDPHYREFAHDIYSSGKHLLEIIDDILDLTKVEVGKLDLDEQNLDVTDLMKTCVHLVAESARAQGIAIELQPPAQFVMLRADATRLKQILLNLLSNAVKFTPSGNHVTLSAYIASDGAFVLEVADTGIGMSTDDLARAMQPFQQIDNSFSKRYQGTGLGLPLAKSLVELHGGELSIESVPSAGTTVSVRLPSWRVASQTSV